LTYPVKGTVKMERQSYSFFERIQRKLKRLSANFIYAGSFNYREYLQHILANMRPSLECEIVSLPFAEYDLLSHPAVKNADIIHLHWVAGFLDYPSFFNHNTKPIVWTLHDMNPILGIYHYKEDEERNTMIAGDLNKKVFELKKKAVWQNKTRMVIVSPSHWLFEEAKQNSLLRPSSFYEIPYTLDTNIFTIKNKEELKKQEQIPEDHTVFLFVAQNIHTYRKGFDILTDALNKLDHAGITLLIIGYGEDVDIPGFNCIKLGIIQDNEKLSSYYSMADAFIIPSREDNLPNVMLESLACGTPVISFNVGGMAEVIKDDFNGIKAIAVNADSLKKALEKFIDNKNGFSAKEIRRHVLDHFSGKLVASKYMNIYKELLTK
jgi:glycosyltransferase involved in cell wall biosynthesis